jgi:hypothetical protein
MIFVALAIAWAVYLIPKALQHHEEIARSRGVDRFSARMRVFGGQAATNAATDEAVAKATDVPAEVVATVPQIAPTLTRAAARRAAARRRRVLYGLTALLVLDGAAAWLGYLPTWTVAIPLVLVVAFLVVARLTVRREQVRHVARPAARTASPGSLASSRDVDASAEPADREDTMGLNRAELDELEQLPLVDEGALWDPLPVTLPTYVSKPRARRTVRTIELTQTAQSSGHDPVDSALVRQAEAAEGARPAEAPEALEEPTERRAAGA